MRVCTHEATIAFILPSTTHPQCMYYNIMNVCIYYCTCTYTCLCTSGILFAKCTTDYSPLTHYYPMSQ